MPAPLAPVDPVAALRQRVGGALEQVVRLADGRLLGVVRGEAPADAVEGAVLLPAGAAAALAALGSASPLAGAELLFQAQPQAGARAFGSSTVEPPESLVAAASTDAVALLARARAAVA